MAGRFDLVIVGMGSAGLVAAEFAARLGPWGRGRRGPPAGRRLSLDRLRSLHVLGELIDRVEARLRTARFFVGDTVSRGLELTFAARDALRAGALGYGVVVARRL